MSLNFVLFFLFPHVTDECVPRRCIVIIGLIMYHVVIVGIISTPAFFQYRFGFSILF
jgi:hypothetical protein